MSDLIKMCYSGKYSEREMQDKVMKKGGLVSYLGTGDVIEVRERIQEGDLYATILTGGVSNDADMIEKIKESCSFIAPIEAIPGEFEMEAMVNGTLKTRCGSFICFT